MKPAAGFTSFYPCRRRTRFPVQLLPLLLALWSPAHAAPGGLHLGNAEIDATFHTCAELDAKRAPIYRRLLQAPWHCNVNLSQLPWADPKSQSYQERYQAFAKKMRSERDGADMCAYVVHYCLEAVPAAGGAARTQVIREWESGQASTEPAPQDAGAPPVSLQGDGRVPQDLDALLAHPNDNTRLKGLLERYKKEERFSDEVLERIMRDPSKAVRMSVVRAPMLAPRQIDLILASRDREWITGLVRRHLNHMTASQLASIVELGIPEFDRQLAEHADLPAELARRLAASGDTRTRFWIAHRFGTGSATDGFAKLLAEASVQDINQFLWALNPVPEQIVDMVLAHPNDAIRSHLTMNAKFSPTPAQIKKILQDPVTDVQVGLLRRRDVPIPSALLDAGAQHPDPKVAFWYLNRPDFKPDANQVEQGLSSPNHMTRRQYAHMEKIQPTTAQIERGLTDSDEVVRTAFARRRDITLTDAQLDRCTTDAQFTVRHTCVQRADYRLTQWRFERILLDTNPNTLAVFTGKFPEKRVDLYPYIEQVLRAGAPDVQIALANNKRIALDDAQLQRGLQIASPEVRAAFEKRRGGARKACPCPEQQTPAQ